MAGGDYGLQDVTQGVNQMDLQEQVLHDLEVARRLQEEELKVGQMIGQSLAQLSRLISVCQNRS